MNARAEVSNEAGPAPAPGPRFAGRTLLLTGGASGIGAAVAALQRRGRTCRGRRSRRRPSPRARPTAPGEPRAAGDVTDEQAVNDAVSQTLAAWADRRSGLLGRLRPAQLPVEAFPYGLAANARRPRHRGVSGRTGHARPSAGVRRRSDRERVVHGRARGSSETGGVLSGQGRAHRLLTPARGRPGAGRDSRQRRCAGRHSDSDDLPRTSNSAAASWRWGRRRSRLATSLAGSGNPARSPARLPSCCPRRRASARGRCSSSTVDRRPRDEPRPRGKGGTPGGPLRALRSGGLLLPPDRCPGLRRRRRAVRRGRVVQRAGGASHRSWGGAGVRKRQLER